MKEEKREIVYKTLDEIKPYERNARNNDNAVDSVVNSVKQFNFNVPITVDKNGVIVSGHTRYKAAKKLGLERVPVIVLDDLTDDEIKAYRLADNKTGELASWDNGLLDSELKELLDTDIDMEDFGFEVQLNDVEDEDEKVEGDLPVTDNVGIYHDYIVLKFETEIDWLQAQTFFNLKKVKWDIPNTKKIHVGVGRVLNGSKIIKQLLEKGVRLDETDNV